MTEDKKNLDFFIQHFKHLYKIYSFIDKKCKNNIFKYILTYVKIINIQGGYFYTNVMGTMLSER